MKKEYDQAIADLDDALKLDAKSVFANAAKAVTLAKLKRDEEAKDYFEDAVKLGEEHWILRQYSLFRATCPDAAYRDGAKAVEMAKRAIELAGKVAGWEYTATLAAAYAEAGEFELAIQEQHKLLDDKHIDATDRSEQEARLAIYRDNKPYRDE